MRLFLDCEYNESKGELISIAIVSEDGKEWYEVVPCEFPKEWVNEHVIPILGKTAIPYRDMQHSLELWLSQFDSVHVIADWPEDIQHFCNALIIGAGMRINTPPLTMEVLRIDAESTLPHNALHDARGIRDTICGSPPPQGAQSNCITPQTNVVCLQHREVSYLGDLKK